MHLTGYPDVARRQWRVVAVMVLVCVGLALVLTELQGRRYQSSVRLLVSGSAAAEQGAGTMFGTQPADAHISVAGHADDGSAILTITVTADDPDTALQVAKAYPVVLPGQLARLHQAPVVADALLTVATPAMRAAHPVAPQPLRNILAGLGAGLLLGMAAAWLRDTFGAGLQDARQIAALVRGNLLAVVAREFDDEPLVMASRPASRRALGYYEVRATLESGGAPRALVVTSPGRGAGTSTLAANLALGHRHAGRRTTLVDAGLRPIAGPADRAAGGAPAPGRQVDADALRRLAAESDVLVVDAPPVRSGGAALLLGALTDGVVLVVRPGRTSRHALRRALRAIADSPVRLLGVVVNAAPAEDADLPSRERAGRLAADGSAGRIEWPRVELAERPSPTFAPPAAAPARRRSR